MSDRDTDRNKYTERKKIYKEAKQLIITNTREQDKINPMKIPYKTKIATETEPENPSFCPGSREFTLPDLFLL